MSELIAVSGPDRTPNGGSTAGFGLTLVWNVEEECGREKCEAGDRMISERIVEVASAQAKELSSCKCFGPDRT